MFSNIMSSRPIRMWIYGKCFSIKNLKESSSKKRKLYETLEQTDSNVERTDEFYLISEKNGKFSTKFRLPGLYYRKLLHVPDFNLNDLSKRTNSEIVIPTSKDDEHILVNSDSKDNLYKTVDKIHSVVAKIRKRNMALQFLCIPCLGDTIRKRFENLKKEILSLEDVDGLHESIFMPTEKLHLTISIFVLLDDNEKMEAINSLHEYKEKTLEPILRKTGPLTIDISGLDCMNNNVKKVDVLYAKAKMTQDHEEHSLQSIVNDLSDHFYKKGFLKEYQENVKLHMTVINTKYRKTPNKARSKRPRRMSIDATKIMEKFKDYHFGTCNFDSIHLSYITLKGEDGFYEPLTVAKLNV